MIGLFFLFFVVQLLVLLKVPKAALVLGVLNLLLCVAMLIHHATSTLQIRL